MEINTFILIFCKKNMILFDFKEHRWKKRGMAVVPVRYPIDYFATNIPATIAIYHMDGHGRSYSKFFK